MNKKHVALKHLSVALKDWACPYSMANFFFDATNNKPMTMDIRGKKTRVTTAIELGNFIRDTGFWGFCHIQRDMSKPPCIHYYAKKATPRDILALFAHELQHILGGKETEAVTTAAIAEAAYSLIPARFKKPASDCIACRKIK